MKTTRTVSLIIAVVSLAFVAHLNAQSTTFTYQGSLADDGSPATGTYDMVVRLFDLPLLGTSVGTTLAFDDVDVTGGLFTVELDFGMVFAGSDRYLEISVRPGISTGNHTLLSPRQKINAAPYAITAQNLSGNLPNTGLSGTYSSPLNLSNTANRYSGNGSVLTQLNASQLKSGTVPDNRLGGNVARLNTAQTFSADNVFSASVGIGSQPPTERLDVNGRVRIRGGSPGSGKVLTSDANGTAGWSPQKSSARVVVVDAAGGGDYTTIGAALAAINPTANRPYIVEVKPGNYTERVMMKSHVHLRGSGMDSTAILFDPAGAINDVDQAVVRLNQLVNVAISHLTLAGRNYADPGIPADSAVGILDQGSSPVVREVRVTTLVGYQPIDIPVEAFGIASANSRPLIENCVFDTEAAADGVSLLDSSARIVGNQFGEQWHAVTLSRSSALVANNTMLNATECVFLADSQSSATIANNSFRIATSGDAAVRNSGEVRMLGNEIIGDFNYGIYNEGPAIVSGNLFEVTGLNAVRDEGPTRSTFSANRFRNSGGSGERAVALVNSSSVLVGNVFSGSPHGDITVAGGNPTINNNVTPGVVSGSATIAGHDDASIRATTDQLVLDAPGGVGIGTSSPNAPVTVEGTGTTAGGVAGFPEVMIRTKRAGNSHSAISVDAETGRDAILYFAEAGVARWGIRHDASKGSKLDIRYHPPGGGGIGLLTLSTNGTLTTAGPINPPSDRNLKQDFTPAQPETVLKKISALPIQTWTYKKSPGIRHIGPMAQDFYAAFELGDDDRHIATVDADGVALAAIQGLNQKVERIRAELKNKDNEVAELKDMVNELMNLVKGLNRRQRENDQDQEYETIPNRPAPPTLPGGRRTPTKDLL